MNALDHRDPLPFNDPDSPPDAQVAIGMVLDLRREVERQEEKARIFLAENNGEKRFWRFFAVGTIVSMIAFLFWSSSLWLDLVEEIRNDIKAETGVFAPKDHLRIVILEKEILRLEALAGVEPSQDMQK